MEEIKDYLRIDFNTRVIDAAFIAMSFAADGWEFAYIPSLDLSAYGKTKKEALEMLDVCLKDVMDTLLEAGEVPGADELKRIGREKSPNPTAFIAPFVDIHGFLRGFELPEDTEIQIRSIVLE